MALIATNLGHNRQPVDGAQIARGSPVTHKMGMDKWGDLGITEIDVFVKGQKNPAFIAKDALKLLGDREYPTKVCTPDFR
jgi:hypothetical protein